MTDYPPPAPPPPPLDPARPQPATTARRRVDLRTLGWLLLIAVLIGVGIARQRHQSTGTRVPTSDAASSADQASGAVSEGDSAGDSATGTWSPRSPEQPSSTAEPSSPAPVTSAAAPPASSGTGEKFLFTMPDLAGVSLQKAQNSVQAFGVFFSRSHDLRGSRRQLLDRNWQVCDQRPAAGTRLFGKASDLEGAIDFGVVKSGEKCP